MKKGGGVKISAKSIESGQSAQSAQTDLDQNILLNPAVKML